MKKPELNPRILKYLKEKLKGKVSEYTIQPAISRIRRKYPSLTLNAAAEVFARKYDESIQKFFNDRDRDSLKTKKIEKITIKTQSPKKRSKLIIIARYETNDKMLKAHLNEINKTYTYGCYTATFVLCRKVLENLIIHNILKKKFSAKSQNDREKYFDFGKKRFLDFSKLLYNLRSSSNDFASDNKLVERICELADGFKDPANDMTHSLYHIAKKKEIDDKNFQEILDLILRLEKNIN